jgi:hypothetical protein
MDGVGGKGEIWNQFGTGDDDKEEYDTDINDGLTNRNQILSEHTCTERELSQAETRKRKQKYTSESSFESCITQRHYVDCVYIYSPEEAIQHPDQS